jgi:hypothetical protein
MEIKKKIAFPQSPTKIHLNRLQINTFVLKFNTFRRQICKSWAISNGLRAETDQPEARRYVARESVTCFILWPVRGLYTPNRGHNPEEYLTVCHPYVILLPTTPKPGSKWIPLNSLLCDSCLDQTLESPHH